MVVVMITPFRHVAGRLVWRNGAPLEEHGERGEVMNDGVLRKDFGDMMLP